MSKKTDAGRLTGSERADFLTSMRKTAAPAAPRATAVAAPTRDVSFETLPGFRMLKTQRAAADMLGLANPFYQTHTARAGARSVIDQKPVANFASYDYLGLNGHPEITAAVADAAGTWGTSVSASRLTAGERPFHQEFEQALAGVYGTEDALVFVGGHATNISTIAALLSPKDLVIHDALAHNSIVVGAELSKASRRIFPHNDLDALEAILAASRDKHERCLIVTEGLFSMDGDGPDLARLIEIKTRWGAWLMVDEAHSLGVLGATGRGIFELQGVDPSGVDIWMGTLSKTLVGCGGYIAGSADLVTFLKFHAPGMVYSVGLPATLTIGSLTALRIMQREPERVAQLKANGHRFLEKARAAGLDVGESWGYAVTPIIIGDSLRTVMLAGRLLERGINAFPIIPPGVPEKSARLRFFISASHTPEDIDTAVTAVAEELARLEEEGISVGKVADLMK
ncbi:8-amino-7-oxononanoate synthase [Azorhizobium oxalatiphilum]|uniref:8-amino-7-oxononanoate synthase n=1 Tax=Azorhizobium oxalatiphilum TaxID=980631 RepID=A0A917FFM5_9HYPH|nr:aminotransferase class I/II-fold pyridoxal phosphate-dependent enzyme [Azorhizobium oxalatiphilum]GGF80244.1 8-amino-7-oxononanoate synthase [Azorhizobium oxalatiphilum]